MPRPLTTLLCNRTKVLGVYTLYEAKLLETAMYRPANVSRQNAPGVVRTVVVSALGLLPMGVVSGMMLMQIFGYWTY
jgi:hypothetical protein